MSKDLPASTIHHSKQDLALLVLVILIGLNLRPFLTAIGPLACAASRAQANCWGLLSCCWGWETPCALMHRAAPC